MGAIGAAIQYQRILRRILLVPFGYVVASLAAGLFIAFALFGLALLAPDLIVYTIVATLLVTINAATVGFFPALVVIAFAEILGWRSVIFYLAAGMAIGVIGDRVADEYLWLDFVNRRLTLLIAAGFVGGLVYWAIAGRDSGLRAAPA